MLNTLRITGFIATNHLRDNQETVTYYDKSANYELISFNSLETYYPCPFLGFFTSNLDILCLQWEKNSLLLFKSASSGLNKIWNFSLLHRLHTLLTGLNDLPLSTILHLISKSMFASLSSCTWLLMDVWLLFLFLKVCLCCPSLALKSVEARPM